MMRHKKTGQLIIRMMQKKSALLKLRQVKKFGAVLVKTNVLLVLPNKLAELGAVYDCLH